MDKSSMHIQFDNINKSNFSVNFYNKDKKYFLHKFLKVTFLFLIFANEVRDSVSLSVSYSFFKVGMLSVIIDHIFEKKKFAILSDKIKNALLQKSQSEQDVQIYPF